MFKAFIVKYYYLNETFKWNNYLYSPEKETQTLFSSWWKDDGFLCLLKADSNGDCLRVWVVCSRASRVRVQICVLTRPHSDHMLPSTQYPSKEFNVYHVNLMYTMLITSLHSGRQYNGHKYKLTVQQSQSFIGNHKTNIIGYFYFTSPVVEHWYQAPV